MARSLIRPSTQVKTVDAFDDTKAPGVALEDPNGTLEDLLQAILSQINRILDANGANWYDAVSTVNAKTRALLQLNTDLDDLEEKRLLFVTSDLADVTVADATNVAILPASAVPVVSTAAVGTSDTIGTVVAAHTGTFGEHSLDEVTGKNAVSPKNMCIIIDGETGAPILSDNDKPIIGLLQVENATDGHTMSGTTPNRVQISFARVNDTEDDIEAAPVDDFSGGKTVKFSYIVRTKFDDVPEDAFLGGAIFSGAGGGGVGGGSGSIYITDVNVPSGTLSGEVWQNPVAKTVLQEGTVSDLDVEIVVKSAYPMVSVNKGPLVELQYDAVAEIYYGSIPVTLSGPGDVEVVAQTPDDKTGAKDTVKLYVNAPPSITSALFTGNYPLSPNGVQQGALAVGQPFSITVTADKPFKAIRFLNDGAAQLSTVAVSPASASETVAITAADRGPTPQYLGVQVQVQDPDTDAWSAVFDTTSQGTTPEVHVVQVDNLRPAGSGTPNYLGVNQALNGGDVSTVDVTITNADTVLFEDPTGTHLTITDPTVIEAVKTVTAKFSGVYSLNTVNFRGTLVRDFNGAVTIFDVKVKIVDVDQQIQIDLPADRLISGGNYGSAVQDHEILIISNQQLLEAPTMNADSGGNRGTFLGSWAGGPTTWYRDLRIDDTIPDQKGVFTFEGLSTVGLSGRVVTTAVTSLNYELGGSAKKSIPFGALQTQAVVDFEISDFSKVQAGFWQASANQSIKFPIGTPPPESEGYTILAEGSYPTTIVWLDTERAGTSTGTSYLYDFEELP